MRTQHEQAVRYLDFTPGLLTHFTAMVCCIYLFIYLFLILADTCLRLRPLVIRRPQGFPSCHPCF